MYIYICKIYMNFSFNNLIAFKCFILFSMCKYQLSDS